MTHFIINSEHDIEYTIDYLTELVQGRTKRATVELTFPSSLLCQCFMDNLVVNLEKNNIPKDIGLDLKLYLPPEEDTNE